MYTKHMNSTEILKTIPAYVTTVSDKLGKHGYQAYLVGGSLRDLILKKIPNDFDIATDALPEEIEKIFPKSIATGARFGTITVVIKDQNGESFDVEVTTFRSEAEYRDGRWPTKVSFSKKIEDDLERRDFTINAMAFNLLTTTFDGLVDLFDGQKDIEKKVLRAVGDPIERLSEDGLRALRACRLAANLEFSLDPRLKEGIKQTLHVTAKVSVERVRDELNKMFMYSPKPSTGIRLMKELGLLELCIPELLEGEKVTQPKYHEYDVFEHSLRTLDLAEDSIKWAALLHDIGKPRTIQMTEDGEHFYRHDEVGSEMAEKVLKRLRFPNAEIDRIKRLIRWHMFFYPEDEESAVRKGEKRSEKELKEMRSKEKLHKWSDSAIRRFIRNVGGEDAVEDLIRLRIADASANPKSSFDPGEIDRLADRISQVRKKEMTLTVNDLDITGHDLSDLGIEKGPRMKEILELLLDDIIEDPLANKREILLKKADKFSRNNVG